MDINIVNSKVTRRDRGSRVLSHEFTKKINQENLLIELSERVQLEMERLQLKEKDLQEALGVNQAYVQGLLHGFADITLRELADVFTTFDRLLKLVPIERKTARFVVKHKSIDHPQLGVSEEDFQRIAQLVSGEHIKNNSITITFQEAKNQVPSAGWLSSPQAKPLEDTRVESFTWQKLKSKIAENRMCENEPQG